MECFVKLKGGNLKKTRNFGILKMLPSLTFFRMLNLSDAVA